MRTLKFISASAIALLLSVGFVSCGGDSEGEDTEKVLIENFNQSNVNFTDQSSEQSFSFTANSSWTVSVSSNGGDTSWCSVYPSSGGKGTQTVTIRTTANTSYDDRNATITLTSGTQTKSFVVTQKQKNALLLTSDKFEVDNTGGTITVEVKANISYTATIGSDCTDWIKEESGTRALTTTTKTFTISPSEEVEKREGTITFSDGTLSETVHVYQSGGYSVVLNQRNYVIDQKGGEIAVELRSNCDYEVIMPSVDWIKENQTRAMSSHTLYYTILENTSYDNREAYIIYKDKQDLVRDTLIITQAQINAVILVDKKVNVGSIGGTVEVKVKSNVDYEVVMPDVDWVSLSSKTRGLTESVEQFIVKENSTHDNRSVNIVFKTEDGKKDTLVISQSQLDALILNDKNIALESKGGTVDVKIMSNVDYEVVIPKDVDWITVGVKTRGLTESEVHLIVNENVSYDSRSGRVIFQANDGIQDTLYVTQAQKNALIITNKNIDVDPAGGTIDVQVKSNVEYKVEIPNDVSWITIAPQSRALDESTVQFIVDENTGDTSRSTNILFSSSDGLKDTLSIQQACKITVITVKTLGTFEKLFTSLKKPRYVKIVGPVYYKSELEKYLSASSWLYSYDGCIYCDLSEATIYDSKGNIMESIKSFANTIKTLIMPNYITSIEEGAFCECSQLNKIVLPSNLESIGKGAFAYTGLRGNLNISESVQKMGEYSFYHSTIDSVAFYCATAGGFECSGLKYVFLSDNVKKIDDEAFWGCDISSVTIPNSVTSIGKNAFDGTNLSSISIPNSVTSIGESAFKDCYELKSVVLPDNIEKIEQYVFSGTGLVSIVIPNSVTKIVSGAFYNDSDLEKVILPENLIEISGFDNCPKLTDISLPNSVQKIYDDAFRDTPINTPVIPCNVTFIGDEAFTKVDTCYIYAKVPPTLGGSKAFVAKNYSESALYVPKGCLEAYKDWSTMFYNIYEMEE